MRRMLRGVFLLRLFGLLLAGFQRFVMAAFRRHVHFLVVLWRRGIIGGSGCAHAIRAA